MERASIEFYLFENQPTCCYCFAHRTQTNIRLPNRIRRVQTGSTNWL